MRRLYILPIRRYGRKAGQHLLARDPDVVEPCVTIVHCAVSAHCLRSCSRLSVNIIDNMMFSGLAINDITDGDPWENLVVVQRAQLDKEQMRTNVLFHR